IGHLVLHQGADGFSYEMAAGHLAAGEQLSVDLSALSAPSALLSACVGPATLTLSSSEGLAYAPILKWPVKKKFDDLPIVLGWSKTKKHYELVYTNENGGTTASCGGGADGIQAEVARWGRA